jgi:hypothetical protein
VLRKVPVREAKSAPHARNPWTSGCSSHLFWEPVGQWRLTCGRVSSYSRRSAPMLDSTVCCCVCLRPGKASLRMGSAVFLYDPRRAIRGDASTLEVRSWVPYTFPSAVSLTDRWMDVAFFLRPVPCLAPASRNLRLAGWRVLGPLTLGRQTPSPGDWIREHQGRGVGKKKEAFYATTRDKSCRSVRHSGQPMPSPACGFFGNRKFERISVS